MPRFFKKSHKKTSPSELYKNHGNTTRTNITSYDLKKGADKQWKRFNDSSYKDEEFEKKLLKVFGNK